MIHSQNNEGKTGFVFFPLLDRGDFHFICPVLRHGTDVVIIKYDGVVRTLRFNGLITVTR